MRRKIYALIIVTALLMSLCACGGEAAPAETVDPYAGMVQVDSGFGTLVWATLYEDVPVSTLDKSLFQSDGRFINYSGSDLYAMRGIDVSEHQANIEWQAVAEDGVEFAVIRAGYRGYSKGGLYEDEYFKQNIEGALENGIKVGVYFFSQAVDTQEAVEEAEYLLELIDGYDVELPVVYDWESISQDDARTNGVDGDTLTDCAVAFCERVREAGYDPAVYAYRYLAYFYYDLSRLTGYKLWIGAVGSSPDFYYKHDIWQYSDVGRVSGINGEVDLNLMFTEKRQNRDEEADLAEPEATPEIGETAAETGLSELTTMDADNK